MLDAIGRSDGTRASVVRELRWVGARRGPSHGHPWTDPGAEAEVSVARGDAGSAGRAGRRHHDSHAIFSPT